MSNPLNNRIVKNLVTGSLAANFKEYITRNKAEEEREQLIEDLTIRNQDLSQFAYITSHNLRAPLSNLMGLIDILNYDLLDEYNKTIVDMFRDSAYKLNETIYDLTQMLSIKNKKNHDIELVNIVKTFKKVCDSFTRQIHTMGISILTDFQCESVPFNKIYLESVLMNFMSNAVKYHSENRTLKIEVMTRFDENDNILLSFSDNGLGIDLGLHKDRIFGMNERFHHHVNGSGMGLFITKTQITALRGEIQVKSEVDKGTTFFVTIKNELM